MRVLIACERSGKVRREFRKLGHEAYSCDIEPADDGSEHHIQQDAIMIAYSHPWDLMIAHPECTYLANSGAKNLYLGEGNHRRKENGPDPDRWAQMGYAAQFYVTMRNAPIKKKVIENPIMLGHVRRLFPVPKPTQIIQPWMFGEFETKATALDIQGLPLLQLKYKTWQQCRDALGLPADARPEQRMFLMGPGPDRKRARSETYTSFAQAWAEQWGAVE